MVGLNWAEENWYTDSTSVLSGSGGYSISMAKQPDYTNVYTDDHKNHEGTTTRRDNVYHIDPYLSVPERVKDRAIEIAESFGVSLKDVAKLLRITNKALHDNPSVERMRRVNRERLMNLRIAAIEWRDAGYVGQTELFDEEIETGRSMKQLLEDDFTTDAVEFHLNVLGARHDRKPRW